MQLVNEVWATEVLQVVVGGKHMGAAVQISLAKLCFSMANARHISPCNHKFESGAFSPP